MRVTPDPVISVLSFTENDKLIRVNIRGENVIDFSISNKWTIREVTVTGDRKKMILTVERSEE